MTSPAVQQFKALPAAWLADRLVCSRRGELGDSRVAGDDEYLVTLTPTADGLAVAGYGAAAAGRVAALAAAGALSDRLRWVDLPRGARLDEAVCASLRLELQPGWDWLWTDTVPEPDGVDVAALDPVGDAAAIRDCLADASPDHWGDPGAADDVGWWGVRQDGRLAGVIGVSRRSGRTEGSTSWHLKGLGVRPDARGRGLGTALTAAATRAGLASGAEWVSLGVWASNEEALRIYHRLGFRTGHQRASYRQRDEPGAACNG